MASFGGQKIKPELNQWIHRVIKIHGMAQIPLLHGWDRQEEDREPELLKPHHRSHMFYRLPLLSSFKCWSQCSVISTVKTFFLSPLGSFKVRLGFRGEVIPGAG